MKMNRKMLNKLKLSKSSDREEKYKGKMKKIRRTKMQKYPKKLLFCLDDVMIFFFSVT